MAHQIKHCIAILEAEDNLGLITKKQAVRWLIHLVADSAPAFARDDTFVSLSASHNPIGPTWLETLTLTAGIELAGTVTEPPTGTVTFTVDDGSPLYTIDDAPLGPVAVTNATATTPSLDQSKLSLGHHTVVAAYSGDDHFQPGQTTLDLVAIAAARPDAHLVDPSGVELGDDVYNADATAQTHTTAIGSEPVEYQLIVENDGTAPEPMHVQLPDAGAGFTVDYRLVDEGADTPLRAGGTRQLDALAPGERALIVVRVQARPGTSGGFDPLLTVESGTGVVDAVRPVISAGPITSVPAVAIVARVNFTG